LAVADNVLTVTGTSVVYFRAVEDLSSKFIINHKYYVRYDVKVSNVTNFTSAAYAIRDGESGTNYAASTGTSQLENVAANTWYTVSSIGTATVTSTNNMRLQLQFLYSSDPTGKIGYLRNLIAIDLTDKYGPDNEPSKAQMDAIVDSYPNSWFNITAKANL
jgi:hypothetical protein